MAGFDVQTITAAGASLIAAATAQNKLILDGCDATTAVLTREQAIAISSRPSNPGSNTADVALAGSTDNHVYAYAEFIRGSSTGGEFNTFYLYGHSQSNPSDIRVIAVVSAAATTHLPTSLDTFNRSEIQFELTFSATDEVVEVASTSMYTTRGEFLLLKNRTVTTHAEGETTVGDNQTIYGIKAFADGIKLSTIEGVGTNPVTLATQLIPGSINAKIGTYDNRFSEVCTHYLTHSVDTSQGYTLVQTSGAFSSVGTSYYANWMAAAEHKSLESRIFMYANSEDGTATSENIVLRLRDNSVTKSELELKYIKSTDKGSIRLSTDTIELNGIVIFYDNVTIIEELEAQSIIPYNVGESTIGASDAEFLAVYSENIYVDGLYSLSLESILLKNSLIPDDTIDLGSDDAPFQKVQAGSVYTNNILTQAQGQTIVVDSLVPNGSAIGLGTSQFKFYSIYSEYVNTGSLVPLDNISDIGNSSSKFRKLYADEIHGVIPSVSTYLEEPEIGAIFFAGITVSGAVAVNAGATAKVGLPLSSGGSNVTAIGTVTWDMQTNKFTSLASFSTSTGSYKLLCGVNKSSSDTYCCALVIRVS